MNAPLSHSLDVAAFELPADIAAPETVFADRCTARALLHISGELPLHDAVDELQVYAEDSGLVDRIGQDAAQEIMGEAFAMVDLLPEGADDLSEACEREIMLRAADLAQQWEAAYRPRPEPPRRREPYRPAESTVAAFWYVAGLDDPDYLARWLDQHPADKPHLFKLWKGRQCAIKP